MEPAPEVATVVREIFRLAAQGNKTSQIARTLYQNSLPTPGEYKAAHGHHTHDISRSNRVWQTTTIVLIIEDECYIGTYVMRKKIVKEVGAKASRSRDKSQWIQIPNHHPDIEDEELFQKANSSIRRYTLPKKQRHDYSLRGKIFCGCFHHALSRTMHKISNYYCRYSKVDMSMPCHDRVVPAPVLEAAMFTTIRKQFEDVLSNVQDTLSTADQAIEEKSVYEAQVEAITDKKQRLFESSLSGEIDSATFQSEKAICDGKLQKVKNAYAVLTAQAKERNFRPNNLLHGKLCRKSTMKTFFPLHS